MNGSETLTKSAGERATAEGGLVLSEDINVVNLIIRFGEDRGFTIEENELLNRMAVGELDGFVGPGIMYRNCVSILLAIQNGIPVKYKQRPNKIAMKKGIIVRELGDLEVVQEWRSEEEKLLFLRAFGDRMDDDDVREYVRTSPPIMTGSILCEDSIWKSLDLDSEDHLVS